MKRTLYFFLAIFLPGLIFLSQGMFLYAFIATLLQATGIGWIVASIWAWKNLPEREEAMDEHVDEHADTHVDEQVDEQGENHKSS